jgi:hypothetical protein
MDFGLPGVTLGKLLQDIANSDKAGPLLEKHISSMTTVGDVLNAIDAAGIMDKYADVEIGGTITLGRIVDEISQNPDLQSRRDQEITVKTTLGKLLDLVGEDNVKTFLEEKAAEASYVADYENTVDNVSAYWINLLAFILIFALLSTVTLEFIDKDKR